MIEKRKNLILPSDASKAKIFCLLFGREPPECDLIITLSFDNFPSHFEGAVRDNKPLEFELIGMCHQF